MRIYLVGGAVRDFLLDVPHQEKDWVVVGGTVNEMLEQGFKPVGKDFPVFLHPTTHEEYALARTERKVALGYKGFTFHADKNVTLEQDLARRDLTINAIAQDENGQLIDPFNGQVDLKNKVLRHVSDAFAEDPVRILRVARFAARFGDFSIAPETMQLMQKIVKAGEVNALVAERVWQETERALQMDYPHRFFETLKECGALKIIFPEIDALFGVPNPEVYHPEIDSGIHTLLALKRVTQLTPDSIIRLAIVLHDVGKATTPPEEWPKHVGHAEKGLPIIQKLCQRLRIPHHYCDLACLVCRYHSIVHKIFNLNPNTLLKLLQKLDVFRRPERLEQFLIACQADAQGRQGFENDPYPQADYLRKISKWCTEIDIAAIIEKLPKPTSGADIEQSIYLERLEVIKKIMSPPD